MQMPNDPEFRAAVQELLQTPEFADHPLNRKGGGMGVPESLATLQESAPARFRYSGEPAKWQASMGPAAQAILASNAGVKNFDELVKPLPGGGFDYSRVKPMRSSEELLANPEFTRRMTTEPDAVSGFYSAVTNRSLGDDLKLRIKEENDRQSDINNSLRRDFLSGNAYTDPDTGIMMKLRTTEMPDTTNPLGGMKQERKWMPAPADLQMQWQANAPRILGRPAHMGPTALALRALEKEYPSAQQHFYNSVMLHMEGGAQLPEAIQAASTEVKQRHSKIMEDKLQRSNDNVKLKNQVMDATWLAMGMPWMTTKGQQEARLAKRFHQENAPLKQPAPGAFDDIMNQPSTGWPSGM